MLNRSASLAMSTSVLKALPGKLDIKRHSPSILYLLIVQTNSQRSHPSEALVEMRFLEIIRLEKQKHRLYFSQKVSEYDQEMPQSHISDQPTA